MKHPSHGLLCALAIVLCGFCCVSSAQQKAEHKLTPDQTKAEKLYNQGMEDAWNGKADGVDKLRQAIALDPKNPTYHMGLASLLGGSPSADDLRFKEARIAYDMCRGTKGQEHYGLILASWLVMRKRFREAERVCDECIHRGAEDPSFYLLAARIAEHRGESTRSLASIWQAHRRYRAGFWRTPIGGYGYTSDLLGVPSHSGLPCKGRLCVFALRVILEAVWPYLLGILALAIGGRIYRRRIRRRSRATAT